MIFLVYDEDIANFKKGKSSLFMKDTFFFNRKTFLPRESFFLSLIMFYAVRLCL